jgi:hypothetical protein
LRTSVLSTSLYPQPPNEVKIDPGRIAIAVIRRDEGQRRFYRQIRVAPAFDFFPENE